MRFQPSTAPIEETPTFEGVAGVIKDAKPELARMGVVSVFVFGSVSRGDADVGSDVDLAVQPTERQSLRTLRTLAEAGELLAERLGRPVDVSDLPLPLPLAYFASDDLRMVF